MIVSSTIVFRYFYEPKEKNLLSAIVASVFVVGGILIFTGIWMFGIFFNVWTESAVYYVKRDNPKVKIISRYINEGAWSGGTEPSDYHIVLHRPFLFIYKMETSIDTTSIDKEKWMLPDKNFR